MRYLSRLFVCALLLSLLTFASVPGQVSFQPAGPAAAAPVEATEELVYEGELSKALLRGLNVAELRFTISHAPGAANSAASNQKAQQNLHLTMEAVSKGILSKLFKLNFRQLVESTVEPASFTVLQTNKLDEQGKRRRISEAVFDRSEGRVVWTETDPNDPNRPPRVVTNQWTGAVQDIASAFYFLRTQPLAVGQTYELLISDSGQLYHTPVRVTERKRMRTVLGQVWTLRVEPEVFGEGHLLRGTGKMSLWYTDDPRRIPVKAHISNELGTLDIKLKSAQKLQPVAQ